MKKIFALCAMLAMFANVDAMNGAKEDKYGEKVPARLYVVRTVPPIEILQLPTQKRVVLDNGIIAPSINISTQSYNGIKTKGDLSIRYDMSLQQMLEAISTFVGRDKYIEFSEGWLK